MAKVWRTKFKSRRILLADYVLYSVVNQIDSFALAKTRFKVQWWFGHLYERLLNYLSKIRLSYLNWIMFAVCINKLYMQP